MCVFLLVVFAAPQQETTLASPRRTSRKPLPGPAALGSLRSPSLRRPRKGRSGREEHNDRTNFTPAEIGSYRARCHAYTPFFGIPSFVKQAQGYLSALERRKNKTTGSRAWDCVLEKTKAARPKRQRGFLSNYKSSS
jgi:hypothetical protein